MPDVSPADAHGDTPTESGSAAPATSPATAVSALPADARAAAPIASAQVDVSPAEAPAPPAAALGDAPAHTHDTPVHTHDTPAHLHDTPAHPHDPAHDPVRDTPRERPVIGFLTDFGLDGPAAICRGVMLGIVRDAQIVDISHTVRKFAIGDGAYLLRAAVPWLPVGVHVAVVDPGVGTGRRPVAIRTARGDVLVGPDNGLLLPAAERLGGVVEARQITNPEWILPETSATFHGRDVFAPVAARLATGAPFEAVGEPIDPASLVRLDLPDATTEPGRLSTGVTYVDSFGNLRLAGGLADLEAALGDIEPGTGLILELGGPGSGGRRWEHLRWRRTFGEASAGELLAYEDSAGNLAVAVSNGDAAARLGVGTGAPIGIRRA
ncbi:MAG TPA: SAM-dependent chlorinase/fluorinase [Candidatus Binatia bacterium]|nr:SAM-dependent chlorinase/fluorinase [Candidatus Binatia bacterium]